MSMIEAIESIGIPKTDVLRLVNMDSKQERRKENNDSSKADCRWHKACVMPSANEEIFQ